MSEECNTIDLEADYDMKLHIGSIFIIASFSLLGTTIPLILKKYFSMSSLIFQTSKLVGAGVILSTAFSHMITAAFENLMSPCAEIEYGALAGVCALIGALFTLIVQLIASEALSSLVSDEKEAQSDLSKLKVDDKDASPRLEEASSKSLEDTIHSHNSHTHEAHCLSDINILEIGESAVQDDSCHVAHKYHKNIDSGHDHSHGGVISHSNRITAYLLEFGIAMHSIIIGISLGLAREEFVTLLVALVFHQFFEGIGLSSVVSEAEFGKKYIAVGLVVFYCISTPIGIAIGIGLHESLNENAKDYLVTQGVLDGLSAGILIYDGLVNIVLPHFNGKNYRHSSLGKKSVHILALITGSALMSIVAIWA